MRFHGIIPPGQSVPKGDTVSPSSLPEDTTTMPNSSQETVSPQEFGRLQGQVETLTTLLKELRDDVKELTAAVENAKGSWKTVLFLGSVSAGLGALFMKFIAPFIAAVPR